MGANGVHPVGRAEALVARRFSGSGIDHCELIVERDRKVTTYAASMQI